jgi:protein-S-isoprenylcysteine O-methyltransferase Ste14
MRRAHLWFQTGLAAYIFAVERIMPVSAYFQSVLFLILTAVALFASAGSLAIPGFWLYLAIFAAIILASLLELDPDLLRERMRPGGKRPPLALRLFTIVLFVHWIVAGLDRGRFHWSDSVPPWLRALGLIVFAAGFALCFWAMAVNRFFSSVVRIQAERGQYVVTTGPYAYVRHPGYLTGILIMVASGPALGSWLAAVLLVVSGCRFCSIARSRKIGCYAQNSGAIATMQTASVGAFCREFGETDQGSRIWNFAVAHRRGPAGDGPWR